LKHKDLTKGSIFKILFTYSLPIVITNVVQLLFHAADVAVLSVMADGDAVAAVGACGSIITLLVSLFTGFAAGANVLVAKRMGERNEQGVRKGTGTALTVGFLSGIFLMIVALIFAKRMLMITKCQPAVLDLAATYMRIYFLGMPTIMLYNFAVAVLRATGNSVGPMTYSMVSGVLNVILNVIFIAVFKMTVEGVALATVLSNLVALILALTAMMKKNAICRIEKKNLRIRKVELLEIVRIGVPTCFCSVFFYVGNIFLSTAVNSMGTDAMTANAISGQFDGVIYTVGAAIALATSAIVGQNFGAKRFDRIQKTIKTSVLYVMAVSIGLGILFVIISDPLLRIMSDSESVIAIAKDRMTFLCLTYFVTSIMEVLAFSLRALHRQKVTMYVGAISGLALRAFWALYAWPLLGKTLSMLFAIYAISALVAIAIYLLVYLKTMKKLKAETMA